MYVNARAIIERETPGGTELLLQVAERPGWPAALEFPGGRLEEFESILDALAREIHEETGLRITRVLDDLDRTVWTATEIEVECLRPFFAYQTTKGPVDSVGFFFRCQTEGTLTEHGDAASGHQWMPIEAVATRWEESPTDFHWLTAAALQYYLTSRRKA